MQRREVMVGLGFWLLVAMFMALFAVRAHAQGEDEAWQAFHGQVVISDIMIAPSDAFESGATMVAALRRVERNAVGARDGFWRLHAVAFLDPILTSGTLRLRASDVTAPNQHDQVKIFDVRGQAGQKVVPLPDLVLTAAMGFQAGHKYELAIERVDDQTATDVVPVAGGAPAAASGKADVCAKGMITLR
jgi:hypothetical protein